MKTELEILILKIGRICDTLEDGGISQAQKDELLVELEKTCIRYAQVRERVKAEKYKLI